CVAVSCDGLRAVSVQLTVHPASSASVSCHPPRSTCPGASPSSPTASSRATASSTSPTHLSMVRPAYFSPLHTLSHTHTHTHTRTCSHTDTQQQVTGGEELVQGRQCLDCLCLSRSGERRVGNEW